MNRTAPMQTLLAFDARKLRVTEGANFGDTLSFADELILDDIYTLAKASDMVRLSMAMRPGADHFSLTAETELGSPGADLYLDCCVTLMAQDGKTFEALIFVEVENGAAEAVFLHPMAPMEPDQPYRLVGLETEGVIRKMAEVACVSFSRGTHITMASGAQVPIQDLKAGDRVLTRNEGPQAIRWIGENT
ncbi:MAG: Hint domain-containing protein, partial [Pseudomonadota bacterium]